MFASNGISRPQFVQNFRGSDGAGPYDLPSSGNTSPMRNKIIPTTMSGQEQMNPNPKVMIVKNIPMMVSPIPRLMSVCLIGFPAHETKKTRAV
jgi:hypothetical protein